MIPIQDLLHRIRWDPAWQGDRFRLGYLDRVAGRVVLVEVEDVIFPPGERFSFQVSGEDGCLVSIPFHRVREVWQDGDRIWNRPEAGRKQGGDAS